MTGSALRRATVWLCITLSFTTLLVVLGRSSKEAFPSITSSKPSGTRLAAEVLEADGFSVRQDLTSSPQLSEGEIAIAFVRAYDARHSWSESNWNERNVTHKALMRQVRQGGTLVVIGFTPDFNLSSERDNQATSYFNSFRPGRAYRINGDIRQLIPSSWDNSLVNVWVNHDGSKSMVSYESAGQGIVAHVSDGIGFSNRFIDQADNAAFFANLIRSLAGKNRRVVFTEATFGNIADVGMISALGGWARAAIWQGYLLFGVIAWTASQTFGLPVGRRRRQAGVRDLMEAFAEMLKRSKQQGLAGQLLKDAIRRDLKRSVSLPERATDQQLSDRLPADQANDFFLAQKDPNNPASLAAISRLRASLADRISKMNP